MPNIDDIIKGIRIGEVLDHDKIESSLDHKIVESINEHMGFTEFHNLMDATDISQKDFFDILSAATTILLDSIPYYRTHSRHLLQKAGYKPSEEYKQVLLFMYWKGSRILKDLITLSSDVNHQVGENRTPVSINLGDFSHKMLDVFRFTYMKNLDALITFASHIRGYCKDSIPSEYLSVCLAKEKVQVVHDLKNLLEPVTVGRMALSAYGLYIPLRYSQQDLKNEMLRYKIFDIGNAIHFIVCTKTTLHPPLLHFYHGYLLTEYELAYYAVDKRLDQKKLWTEENLRTARQQFNKVLYQLQHRRKNAPLFNFFQRHVLRKNHYLCSRLIDQVQKTGIHITKRINDFETGNELLKSFNNLYNNADEFRKYLETKMGNRRHPFH